MIVYLCGDEPYFIKQHQVRLEKDADVHRVSSLEEEDLSFLQMGGFFGRHVLTVTKDSYSEKDISKIKALGIEDSENTLILLGKIAKNSKFYKWLEKNGEVRVCERLSEKDGPRFCAGVLKNYGALIKPEAATLFMERSGYYMKSGTLFDVCNSLKQLALMSDRITKEVVMEYPQSEVVNRWKLVGILGNDPAEFMKRMVQAERSGENALSLLAILLRAFRISYKVGIFGKDSLKELGITAFQFRDMRWITETCSREQIEQAIGVLNDGIREQKSGVEKVSSFIRTLGLLIGTVGTADRTGRRA